MRMFKYRVLLLIGAVFLLGLTAWVLLYRLDQRPAHHASTAPVPNFDHIIVIVEENHAREDVINNGAMPYLTSLAQRYSLATNYFAATHPSLPNYITMTSGTNGGITTNCKPGDCLAPVTNLADSIEQSGRTWKAYMEDMPAPCTVTDAGKYAVRHNPFVYYTNIFTNRARCEQHVVPFGQLDADLANNTLPHFVFITPNLCNDMHDCAPGVADNWLSAVVPKLLQSPAFTTQNSLLVVTWDESQVSKTNNVATVLVGPHVRQNYASSARYIHPSLLHTIEAAWGLPTLTVADREAPVMDEFFY